MSSSVDKHAPRTLDPARVTVPKGSLWYKLPLLALVVGGGSLAGAAALGLTGDDAARTQFFFSYLVAFLFWLSIALGGLFFVIVQFATRAGWSVVVRRLAESLMVGLPLFVVLFAPIAAGLHDLYHWTHEEAVATDVLLQRKSAYLNETFFFVRAAVYFAVWAALSVWFYRRSVRQDGDGDPAHTKRMQWWSGPAIVLFALTLTFAAFDWSMSLDPHWFSTMYGVYYFAGAILAAFSVLGLLAVALRRAGALSDVVTTEHFHDIGKLMFAFTVFWAYIAFSQYFLYWYANIPEETGWFAHRWEGTWKQVTVLLGAGHFAVPFFFLMPRAVKRKAPALVAAAVWLLFIHLVDIYWLVMPTLHPHGAHVGLSDGLALVGVGGLYAGVVGLVLRRRAVVPLKDPRLVESLSFENV